MTTIQVIGLSHIHALRNALKLNSTNFRYEIDIIHLLREVPDKRFVDNELDMPRLHPALRDKLDQFGDEKKIVFSQIGGNAHNFLGLFEHPLPFDFILPDQPHLPNRIGAKMIPYHYVAEVLKEEVASELLIFNALRNTVQTPIFHLESPPPVGDNDFCQANLPPVFLTDRYKGMKVAPRSFRYKLWRLHSTLVRQECLRLGIGFIPCPDTSMDQEGFLRPELYVDPLHGNDLYGVLVLNQIAAMSTGNERVYPEGTLA